MDIFTVSLFGHREVDDWKRVNDRLFSIVDELLKTQSYTTFLVGRNGEFDRLAASVIKNVQKIRGLENSDISLVLPYAVADLPYYEKYYDNIIVPESLHGAHPKAAITLKNRWAIDRSDLVVVYAERNVGGAYAAMKYAQKQNKPIIKL